MGRILGRPPSVRGPSREYARAAARIFMQAALSSSRTASNAAAIGLMPGAWNARVLGVVDGLVSVTQRAWGLASAGQRMVLQ